MAQVEPMDIDGIESDFDNKENAFHCNNVLSRTPCTEKGYEELDVSELNMKLRYSITPASSPMSKSLTGPCLDSRNCNSEESFNNTVPDNGNLTRSLNTNLTKTEGLSKSKVLPLQTLSAEPYVDSNRNSAIHRLIDPPDNVMITVSNANDMDENLSLPSTCSSVPDTPEATTPTKEIPKPEGSPIMRGLKSVLSMFRPSQSPIIPDEDKTVKAEALSPVDANKSIESVQVSTPVATNKKDGSSSKRSSPLKESLVFNDDLERELQWKDETTIIFKDEKIPVHKLFFQNPVTETPNVKLMNTTVEHMDISCDESNLVDKTYTNIEPSDESVKNEHTIPGESDNEFLDCETTFTKNESDVSVNKKFEIGNENHVFRKDITDITCPEMPEEIQSENKNVLDNTIQIVPCITPECTDQALPTSDFIPEIDRNNANIIEATQSFLSAERNCYSKTAVNSESKTTKELENPNVTSTVDEKVIKDDGLATDEKSLAAFSLENNNTPVIHVTGDKMKVSENRDNYIDKLPDVCIETLNNTKLQDRINENLFAIETKKNIEIVNDMTVKDIKIISNYSASDDRDISTERIETTECVPKVEEPYMSANLESTPFLELKSNTDSLSSNKITSYVTKDEIPVENKNVGDTINSSNHGESMFSENTNAVENMSVTQTNKHEEDIQINIETPEDNNLTQYNNKTNTVEDDTLNYDHKNDISIKTNIVLQVENLIDPMNFSKTQIDSNDNSKATNVDTELKLSEINIISKTLDRNFEDALENNKETYALQSCSKEDVVLKDDNSVTIENSNLFVKTVSGNDQKVPESLIKKDGTTVLKSPSEIPLPDDDDVEQRILGNSNIILKKEYGQQNTADFEKCESETIMDVESELVADGTNLDHASETLNRVPENKLNIEIPKIEKELNNTLVCVPENCDTQSDHMILVEQMKMSSENIFKGNETFDLQFEQNSSKSKSMVEEIYENDEQNVSKIQIKENVLENIVEEKDPNSTEIASNNEIHSADTDHVINNPDKNEDDNEENMVDTPKIINTEKRIDDLDEEIITSANNSPYVSVTDLDVVSEKTPKDPLEEIENPFVANTQLASSPPISPKIVSKGYNFNFDEIDDPFATKTKIRMSPSRDAPNLSIDTVTNEESVPEVPKKVNRRKSQPDKRTPVQKKNTKPKITSKGSVSEKLINTDTNVPKNNVAGSISVSPVQENVPECKAENCVPIISQHNKGDEGMDDANNLVVSSIDQGTSSEPKVEIQPQDAEIKNVEQTLVISTEKSTSSSEQYFSLGTSSGESISFMNKSKNVFNLPEIDDLNFNPFATKSKMRMSPPLAENIMSPLKGTNDVSKSFSIEQNQCANNTVSNENTELMCSDKDNDSSRNSSNVTCLSKNTNDVDCTVREILTEDEDTVEGPILELDDLKDTEKITDVEIETDMMNFEEAPQQERDENMENGELFIDADAFEFLLNQNKSSTVLDSGKESLFLKFDPLFAKRVSSDGILAALSKVQKRQSTPKKVIKPTQKDFISIEKSTAGPSNTNVNYGPNDTYNEDLSSNLTKPMMVVNPAVSSVTQKKTATPKLNRRSLTFTSPAMAVIDRLLSLSGNTSHLEHDASIPHVGREHSETDIAITQLREMLAEKEINVHNLRSESKELKDRLATLEVQVRGLEAESTERLNKINDLNERLSEKTKMNKSMAIVVEEYERTIASLIAETEQDKKRNAEERMRLIKERDEQTAHLTSMEVSFSDLHSKYEKSKQIILSCKANEDVYKKSIKEFQDNFSKMQNNYELLKQHATSKLNHANQELEKMNRAHEVEVLKLNAMIKRKELHITSLEETLAQKTKANDELTAICDELINSRMN